MLFASTLVVGGLSAAMMIVGIGLRSDGWFLVGISAPVFGLYIWAWIRVWRIGLGFEEEGVVARSWFSTTRYANDDLERWSAEPYTGVLYVLGWPVAGGALEPGILNVDLRDGTRRPVAGSVTFRTTARAQARVLNERSRAPQATIETRSISTPLRKQMDPFSQGAGIVDKEESRQWMIRSQSV